MTGHLTECETTVPTVLVGVSTMGVSSDPVGVVGLRHAPKSGMVVTGLLSVLYQICLLYFLCHPC